jgi:4-amino-4-deoxy-L-arabinose transferase-like glycosyltransferase
MERLRRWALGIVDDQADEEPHRPARGEAWWLALVLVYALTVRWLGLRLGLPYFHHWDESLITNSARGMIDQHSDVPSNFFYGAPLMRLTAIGWRVAAALHLPAAVRLGDEVGLRLVGRAIASTLSASGALATYLAARWSFRDGRAALAAALLYASAAELVWHARFLVTDASVVALTAWTLALAAGYLRRRTLVFGALAVLAAGLTFSFKLTGLATILLPACALLARAPAAFARRSAGPAASPPPSPLALALGHRALLLAVVPAVLGVFLALNPHVRDMWRQSFAEFEGIARHYREGHVKPFSEREPGVEHLASAVYFLLFQSFHTSAVASGLVAAVAGVGVAVCLRRGHLAPLLGLVHGAAVIVAMAWPNRAYLTRMYLPPMPALCLCFGLGLVHLGRLSCREGDPGWRRALQLAGRAAGPLVLAVIALSTLGQSILGQGLSRDARTRALDWLADRAQAEGRELTVAFTPAVSGGLAIGGHGGLPPYLDRTGLRRVREVATTAAATTSGADYILLASHRDLARIWPYEEQWVFTSAPGYTEVARFALNPYEHRLDLIPTWDGRVTAVLLARTPER